MIDFNYTVISSRRVCISFFLFSIFIVCVLYSISFWV